MQRCAALTQGYARGEDLTEEQRDFIWHTIDETKQKPEAIIRRDVRAMFLRQRDRTLARLDDRGSRLFATEIFDLGEAIQEIFGAVADGLLETLRVGYETGAIRIDHDGTFDAADPRVRQAVEDINDNLRDVPVHTRRLINDAIREGQSNGESIDEIAERIRRTYDQMSQVRSRRIASTTTTAAFEAGQQTAFEEAGMTGSMWLSQRDSRVRGRQQDAGHWEADGQMVRLGETFQVAPGAGRPKEALRYPGDPRGSKGNVINCRCTRLPRMDLANN